MENIITFNRKELIKKLKNAPYPILYEIRDNAGFTEFEKKLFIHRYIKNNFVENVFRYKIFCGKTKYHATHNMILLKVYYYIKSSH